MQKLIIIGNVCAAPEQRTTTSGKTVTTFTVAVSRRKDKDHADFFRVAAWGTLGDICSQYLDKGRKVAVTGEVSARAYTNKQGEPQCSLEVYASEVEFLSRSNEAPSPAMSPIEREQTLAARKFEAEDAQFEEITDGDLPF